MALMIKVHERGTDLKKNLRKDIKIATKKLRLFLGISLALNSGLVFFIVKFLLKSKC